MNKGKISIIIPVYNEQRTLKQLLDKVTKLKFKNLTKEMIIVDDKSTDESVKIIQSYKREKGVMVFMNKKNQGKSRSVKRGILASSGDIVVIQDADLEYEPKNLLEMAKLIQEDQADIVYGNRFGLKLKNKGPNYLGNFFLTKVSNVFTSLRGFTVPDMETCYKMAKGKVFRQIANNLKSRDNFSIEPELTARFSKFKMKGRRLRLKIIDINYYPRTSTEGKHMKAVRDGMRAMIAIIKYNLFN